MRARRSARMRYVRCPESRRRIKVNIYRSTFRSVVTLDRGISRVTPTRHSVTPVERTRDPPSAVLAVRGPGRRTGMRYALCGNTPTWPCVRNNRSLSLDRNPSITDAIQC